jgi:hypothetical protein
LLGTGA